MSSTGIIGGAAVPHAPQFFTLPDTEDREQVARVRATMEQVGEGLLRLQPDVVLVASNDHLENFFLHCVPSFTLHCGAEVSGSFAGRGFRWPVASEFSLDLVRRLQAEGFDPAFTYSASIGYEFGIPLTFCGIPPDMPLVPVFVNAYLAPQPSGDRCYAFGRALSRAVTAAGMRAVFMASGGLSHYPGTPRYARPDVTTDTALLSRLREGNLRALLSFDDDGLDRSGNVETRSWQVLAGAVGERTPYVTAQETSWHHDYAVLGWTSERTADREPSHYPPLRADRVVLSDALYRLRMDGAARRQYLDDPVGFAKQLHLSDDERDGLAALDEARLASLGVHPLLSFLARLQVDIERRARS